MALTPKVDPAFEKRLREACVASPEAALAAAGSSMRGLSLEAAGEALARLGPNVLAGEKKKGFVLDILSRFRDPLVAILLVICAVSYLTGDIASGTIVIGMILISVLLSFVQERRSSAAASQGLR